jgi:hypothetical protein
MPSCLLSIAKEHHSPSPRNRKAVRSPSRRSKNSKSPERLEVQGDFIGTLGVIYRVRILPKYRSVAGIWDLSTMSIRGSGS